MNIDLEKIFRETLKETTDKLLSNKQMTQAEYQLALFTAHTEFTAMLLAKYHAALSQELSRQGVQIETKSKTLSAVIPPDEH